MSAITILQALSLPALSVLVFVIQAMVSGETRMLRRDEERRKAIAGNSESVMREWVQEYRARLRQQPPLACKDCRFYDSWSTEQFHVPQGNCRRHAPGLKGTFPGITEKDWCGDFERKP